MKQKKFLRAAKLSAFVGFVFCLSAMAVQARNVIWSPHTAQTMQIIVGDVLQTNTEKFSSGRLWKNDDGFQTSTGQQSNFADASQIGAALLTTFAVTNTQDSGAGSLRQAILDANAMAGADTINISATGTITLQTSLPSLITDIKIIGPGARVLTVKSLPTVGQFGIEEYHQTFSVGSSGIVTISNLTISGGGIHNYGNLTINDCAIINNRLSTEYGGGGVGNHGGTLVINRSTIASNNAKPGNQWTGFGGGVYNDTGRIYNTGIVATTTINNSTISGNTVGDNPNGAPDFGGGGVANTDVPGTTALMYINNSTIANNNGEGVYQSVNNSASTVTLINTIVAGNTSVTGGAPNNFYKNGGALVLNGNNLSNNYGSVTAGASDLTGNPLLGVLRNNGGQTDTQAIDYQSPAIDAGNNSVLISPYNLTIDQRGQPRPSGSRVDIGAYERQSSDLLTASINNVTVTEGNSGTVNAVFTITLNAPTTQNLIFNYQTADGTATAGNDYVAKSGALTIPAFSDSGTISIVVNGDAIDEPNENFYVNFTGVSFNSGGQGVGTINDDDLPVISINDASISEGNGGTKNLDLVASLSTPHTADVTMQYVTANGTATAGSDYVAKSGTLTIPAGAMTGTVSVVINGDILVEDDETFFVNLSGANLVIADNRAVGTIVNDDTQIAANVSITDAYAMGTPSGAATKFTVTLSQAVGFTATINYATADLTATAGIDYTSASGVLTFNPGQTSRDIWIYGIKGDGDYTTNKTFALNLSSGNNLNIIDGQGIGTVADVPQLGSLIFSEFRFRGTNGAYDEFVELYNNRDYPIVVTNLNGDDFGGWSVIAVSPSSQLLEVGYIPLGTTIPAHGHYLFANNRTDQQNANIGYSLGNLAMPDRTYTADVQDGSGLALLNERGFVFGGNGITQASRQDTIGFQGGSNILSLEGGGLAPAGGIVENSEWSFVRRCTSGGTPQDTNDGVADWRLISPNAAVLSGQQSLVGTTRPANLASPSGNECLNIVAPTAAEVTISGRVILPDELGLTGARVTLTDAQGDTRTVLTGKFGAYRFTNVEVGETYIISAASKRYVYAPQIITVMEDLTDVNFNPIQ